MIGLLPSKFRELVARFREDEEYRELLSTSFYAFLVRMAGVGTGFLVTLVTSRYFGAEALGVVSICLGILLLSAVFGKLGLDVANMRIVAELAFKKDYSGIRGTYLTVLKMMLPVSLGISLILYFSADFLAGQVFHKPYLRDILRLNAWMTVPLVLVLLHSESVRGLKKIRTYTFFQTAAISTIAVIILVICVFQDSVSKYIPVYVQFASILIASAFSLVSWVHYSRFSSVRSEYPVKPRELLRISSPMFTTTLMQLFMSWAGTLILAAYASDADVGVFNALNRISIVTNIAILAFNSISMPRFAEAYASKDTGSLKRHAHEAARLILYSSLPVFLVLLLFPSTILRIFGREFPGHEYILYILLAGQFIPVLAGLPSQILNMTGRQARLRNIAIISAIINVSGCFLMIPGFGILGVSIAQVAGTLIWNVLCVWIVRREFGFFTFYIPGTQRGHQPPQVRDDS
ncbi:MAG: oligosaccharide flippase family protein [Bacteroidia bacterium]|nr:oligosaccharide flippase family protein [Bacteroidia bacterium]